MNTIKIMSDGNQAKVGMIVYDHHDDSIGVITYIKNGLHEPHTQHVDNTDVLFKAITNCRVYVYSDHYVDLTDLSKATPEQKKLYWLELEKQTIQFRPEFEAKLKELGIRDQFVNNLFDPKWDVECNDRTTEFKELCLSTNNWHVFIENAFQWHNTNEGIDYWLDIFTK